MFENFTISLNALCNSWAKTRCSSSDVVFTFVYAGSDIQNACEKFHFSFCKFHSLSKPTNKHLTDLVLDIKLIQIAISR